MADPTPGTLPRITGLEPQARHPDRVNVHVDGAFRCGLALEIVQAAGLRVGDPVAPETLEDLERRDLLWKAREAAYNLLAVRPRAEAELRRRLLRKQYPEAVVDACLERLRDLGLLDDGAFAAAFVRDRVRLRPRGARRLVQELRTRGVHDAEARAAVDRVFRAEDVAELDLAREAAAAWARRALGPHARDRDPLRLRRRLQGHLARRGFPSDLIRRVADEVLDGADPAPGRGADTENN